MDYSNLKNNATRLLTSNGIDVTLVIRTLGSYNPSTNSTSETQTEIVGKGITLNYNTFQIDNETIKKDDLKVLLDSTNITQKPSINDYIEIENVRWNIISIKEIKPANITIYYELQVRK